MEKHAIRREAARRLRNITPPQRADASREVSRRLIRLIGEANAQTVMLFVPRHDEPDIADVDRYCQRTGRRRIYPRCPPGNAPMEAVAVCVPVEHFAPGAYNIPEPPGAECVAPGEIDVIVTPGAAFDTQRNRVGRGKAYYDRFFAEAGRRPLRVGAAFDCQIFDAVPVEAHDAPLDVIVTETRILRVGNAERLLGLQ